jgi:co-chaperonin GroES (HSP10)
MVGDRILVRMDPDLPTSTPSGIEVPVDSTDVQNVGTVVSVGSRVTRVAVGDRVVLNVRAPSARIADGRGFNWIIIRERQASPVIGEHVLGVVDA